MPTRVIDVGKDLNSDTVCVRETRDMTDREIQSKEGRYIALSHRWGDQGSNPRFCATPDNIAALRKGINVGHLPATFKDAVIVTRELGIRYLWIDSLCIIQGPHGDWNDQAKRMEDVFSSAYCVIAASCATGTGDGFLKPRLARECVPLTTHTGAQIHVCQAIDDFEDHVIKGELNKRGWVLQERALAHRTIHFTKEQTYWECGCGIRCETLTKMKK